MPETTFHMVANDFVKSLIKQRKYLIRTCQSKADPGFINDCLQEVDKYMSAYKYNSDVKISQFWVMHSEQIYALIPGRNSPVHEATIRKFHELNKIARAITKVPARNWVFLAPLPN